MAMHSHCVSAQYNLVILDMCYPLIHSPEIDSRKARHGLLKSHSDILGSASAFDGSVLFLPKELEKPVSKYFHS